MKKHQILFLFALLATTLTAQNEYQLTIDGKSPILKENYLKMGHPGPKGKEIISNNNYLTIGGKPFIPVMGEFHFSRYPQALWEDVILKMKANGINIIATYVFWNIHEEIEGSFNWENEKNLRAFIELCAKHDLYVYPRIGPWCHGEIRNGGTPDWILTKKHISNRTNDPVYQSYVERLYEQIGRQVSGLMYKDGGPIIGVQLENEYWRGTGGIPHIQWLKETAIKNGFDTPLYTITGWGNVSIPENEVIPLHGGYPTAPWAQHTKKLAPVEEFFFLQWRTSDNIGDNQEKTKKKNEINSNYPYFTCELGVGNQVSYHRRPIVAPIDGAAIVIGRLGSGSNLPGYYVFAGGNNENGLLTTVEENQEYTSNYNRYPLRSYDFQGSISEFGRITPSYHYVKRIHYFLNDFGQTLAPMTPYFPETLNQENKLQYAVRGQDNRGFLFVANYQHGYPRPEFKKCRFTLNLPQEKITLPSKTITIKDSSSFIWPYNLPFEGINIQYATAQPMCIIKDKTTPYMFLFQTNDIAPEISFSPEQIETITINGKEQSTHLLSNLKPGKENIITITKKTGQEVKLIILTPQESLQTYVLEYQGQKRILFSDQTLYTNRDKLIVQSDNPTAAITIFPAIKTTNIQIKKESKQNIYQQLVLEQPKIEIPIKVEPYHTFNKAQPLKIGYESISKNQQLGKQYFLKEFTLNNPAKIKSAIMQIYCDLPSRIMINDRYLNQELESGSIQNIDLTGYLQNGQNNLIINMPCSNQQGILKACIEIEFLNSDKTYIITNQGWIEGNAYTPLTSFSMNRKMAPAKIAEKNITPTTPSNEWKINIGTLPNKANKLANAYLNIGIKGDIGTLYNNGKLLSDHFYYGTNWKVGLNNFKTSLYGQELILHIDPLTQEKKTNIYMDIEPIFTNGQLQQFTGATIIPQYHFEL